MPRKHPVPDEELAICRRLRQFRAYTGLSRASFSTYVGLDQWAYASYEYGRVQLNYPAAWRILTSFRWLNPIWLAEGEDHGIMLDLYFVSYPAPETTGFGPLTLFSRIYETSLKTSLLLSRSAWVDSNKPFPLFRVGGGIMGRLEGRKIFSDILSQWLASQPDTAINGFLNDILNRCSQALPAHPRDQDQAAINRRLGEMLGKEATMRIALAKDSYDSELTKVTPQRNVPGMTEIALLLQRLKRALVGVKKGDLARSLKVPLPRVSEWLSGRVMPSGETALRLLEWVKKREEPLQETPGSATNAAKGKTQVRSYEKKAKSGPIKR